MVSIKIIECEIKRVLINTRNSTDVRFLNVFDELGLDQSKLKSCPNHPQLHRPFSKGRRDHLNIDDNMGETWTSNNYDDRVPGHEYAASIQHHIRLTFSECHEIHYVDVEPSYQVLG